ncbi:EF-Tu/IF-2/RF-3 family GTPase, partial [Klebsiella pneumoniae]
LDASSFLGRIGLVRIYNGTLRKGQQVAWIHTTPEGEQVTKVVKITELLKTIGVERQPATEAVAGDIVAIAGIPDVMIGD